MKNNIILVLSLFLVSSAAAQDTPIRVLSLGNSYTVDALHQEMMPVCQSAHFPITFGFPYKGGTSFAQHIQRYHDKEVIYDYRKWVWGQAEISQTGKHSYTINDALKEDQWDMVVFQQRAKYYDYNYTAQSDQLQDLMDIVQTDVPSATKKGYYMYWSDQVGGKHLLPEGQIATWDTIKTSCQRIMQDYGFDFLIPVGTAIQNARSSYLGDVFNRDTHHLSYSYGRYIAALTWYEVLSGKSCIGITYHPDSISDQDAMVCQIAAHQAVMHPYDLYDMSQLALPATNPFIIGNKRVTFISPTLFRLEYAEEQQFLDEPTLFAYNRQSLLADSLILARVFADGSVELRTDKVRLVLDNDNYPFGQINTRIYFTMGGETKQISARPLHSKTKNLNLGGSVPTLDRVSREIPTQDGLHSSDGWYFIQDNNTEYLTPDNWFAQRDSRHIQDEYCFVYGDDFRAPLYDLGLLSGFTPMTRKYVHGIWYSRWYPYTCGYIDTLVTGYRENNFPLDILSMDMDWHTQDASVGSGHNFTKGWTGYTWNRNIFPDPAELISDLRSDSIYVCLNEHPHDGIRPSEQMYADFMRAMGEPFDGRTLLFDAGDKQYMDCFMPAAHRYSDSIGVAFWWMDWQQDYLYPIVRGSRNMNHLAWLNKIWYEYAQQNNQRGICYSRWGGWGSHRYPLSFSGDADGNWDVLAFEVKLSQTSGSAGCYYWAHDVGGFHGGTNPELLSRWAQFAAFSAALRTHAARGKDLDRRPWIWGEAATRAMRVAYHLRAELLPYTYSSVWQTHTTMVPLNRPLYIDYNRYPDAFNRYNEYLYGDLILVAPITSPVGKDSLASQTLWFPVGDEWCDLFTGERFTGGTIATVQKDLYTFPLYVKAGCCLPAQPYSNHPASASLDTLVIRIYTTAQDTTTTYTLYEDDGISRDYEQGIYATTDLSYTHRGKKQFITIAPTKGQYEGQPTKRAYRIIVDGERTISIKKKDIRKTTQIQL